MALPIEEIVRRNLVDSDRRIGPKLRADQLDKAAAALGTGPDPVAGERVLALVVHTRDNRAGCFTVLAMLNPIRFVVRRALRVDRYDQCWVVTDERLTIRGGGTIASVRWDDVKRATASSGFGAFFGWEFLRLYDDTTELDSVMTPGHQSAARLVRAVVRARDGDGLQRERPPWPQAAGDDPAGLNAARAALDVDDGRAAVLLGRLQAAWLEGRVDDVETLDLARRIVLFARAVAWGRGSRDGAWVSPLRPAELRAAVESSVGPMGRAEPVEPGWSTWVHARSTADAAGRAVAETMLLLMATPKLDVVLPRTDIRLSVKEQPGWTAWRLDQKVAGGWFPLAEADFNALSRVFQRLLGAEAAALAYRCVIDPRAPAAQVVQAPRDETLARLAEADPESRPQRFLVARPQKYVKALQQGAPRTTAAVPGRRRRAPVVADVPAGWRNAGIANFVGGLLSVVLGIPLLWCFGGPVLFVLIDALDAATGIVDQRLAKDVVAGWAALGGMAVGSWGFIQGIFGLIQRSSPRKLRVAGLVVGAISVLGLFAGGVLGAIGGAVAIWLGTRPDIEKPEARP